MSMNFSDQIKRKREYYAIYREKHREKTRAYDRVYSKTPDRAKYTLMYQWKNRYGINFHCYETLYDIYKSTTECNYCGSKFSDTNKKCVDHDHSITDGSDNVRAILCCRCNLRDVLELDDLPKGDPSDAKTKTMNSE